jgi:hypothetical protein
VSERTAPERLYAFLTSSSGVAQPIGYNLTEHHSFLTIEDPSDDASSVRPMPDERRRHDAALPDGL